MKKLIHEYLLVIATAIFLLPVYVFAEEVVEGATGLSGEVSISGRAVNGEDESAKFNEYRDIRDGVFGDVVSSYENRNGYYLEFKGENITLEDQRYKFKEGKYGKYRIELIYDELPHRFAFDAKTLYSGVGSGNLTLDDSIQSTVDAASSSTNIANTLKSYMAGASSTDLELVRRTGKINIDVMRFEPVNLRIEVSKEDRDGTRPFAGSFGFSNTVEIPEPIDYDTTQMKVIAEYSKKPLYLSASYYISIFENNISTLTWDNPLIAEGADTIGSAGSTNNSGPSKGLIDLYPDNRYQNLSLTGSLTELPLKSRLSATASWGKMEQDDDMVPYTTNTAITGTDSLGNTFNAWDTSGLPESSVDAKVDTTLYNVLLTSKPLNYLHMKARYRYYENDNNTDEIEFPGYVTVDESWTSTSVTNEPTSYKKATAGVDIGFDVFKATTLTIGYANEEMKRSENREVSKSDDDIYKISLDTKPASWLDLRASYEKSKRDGDYDYTAPFDCSTYTTEGDCVTAQLLWLQKYDEADRDRDRVQLLATIYPIESLALTGSVIFGKDDFKDSAFGLLEDTHNIYSIDIDYSVSERLNLFAFYSYELYNNEEKAREWRATTTCSQDGDSNNDECTDPYYVITSYDSPSNWVAKTEDRANTFGGGLRFAIMPQKVDFGLTYSYSKTDGTVKLSSEVGANNDVDGNNFTPVDFTEVDDTELHTLNTNVKYQLNKALSITVGYKWEKYDVNDFELDGFTYVPTTSSGSYNGALLMGALQDDYDVSVVYTKLAYKF